MNEMYMQAYTMAAQAQQYFPLSALFRLLNIDGKDRLLPIIEANEQHMQQMQQMQAQMEQMAQQIEGLQKENSNLKAVSAQATNALANVGAARNGGFVPDGTGQLPLDASVSQMRQNILARESSM
jgi:TolA-binding protein